MQTLYIINDNKICHKSNYDTLVLKPRAYDSFVSVNPCNDENWISTDLFKFRLWAERNKKHVIGNCSYNQIPMYSLFCDELIITKHFFQNWYDHSGSYSKVEKIVKKNYIDIEYKRDFFQNISDQEAATEFTNKKIYILKSVYDKFILDDIKYKNVIICELKYRTNQKMKNKICSAKHILKNELHCYNKNNLIQKRIMEVSTQNHYMSYQILGSLLKNWQFLCCGGSSNLMCVLPIKSLFYCDYTMNNSVQTIIQKIYNNLFGFKEKIAFGFHPDSSKLDTFFNIEQTNVLSELMRDMKFQIIEDDDKTEVKKRKIFL